MSESDNESLSLVSDIADHNTWNDLLNLVSHVDFGDKIQVHDELGRLGPSCRYALDWLCTELELWRWAYYSVTGDEKPRPKFGESGGVCRLAC